MKTYLATIPPANGHASDTAAKSTEFQAIDEDAARALCDLHGYRFDGQKIPESEKTWADGKAPNNRLSKKQIITLNILARDAYDHLDGFDLIEEEAPSKSARFALWRHKQQHEVTGHESLKKCRNIDFRPLKLHFLKLAGKPFDAPEALATGQQSADKNDTVENRQVWYRHLIAVLEDAGEGIHPNYLLAIARTQNKYQTLTELESIATLPAAKIQQLLFTLRNRIAAKKGVGETQNRNKNQRKK